MALDSGFQPIDEAVIKIADVEALVSAVEGNISEARVSVRELNERFRFTRIASDPVNLAMRPVGGISQGPNAIEAVDSCSRHEDIPLVVEGQAGYIAQPSVIPCDVRIIRIR